MSDPEVVGGGGPRVRPPQEPFVDSEEFDALLYAYRTAQPHMPATVVAALQAVKDAVAAQLTDLRGERDEWERLQRQSTVLITQISERAAVATDHEAMVREDLAEAQTELLALRGAGAALPQQALDALKAAHNLLNARNIGCVANPYDGKGWEPDYLAWMEERRRVLPQLGAAIGALAACHTALQQQCSEQEPNHETAYCGVSVVGGWCKRAKGHDGHHACS